jgi:hypothetical protein
MTTQLEDGNVPDRAATESTRTLRVVILLSGSGHLVHNLLEFWPTAEMVTQTVFPVAVTGLLYWAAARPSRGFLVVLGTWGLIVLVGAVATVLPLSLLPFEPDQTVGHYLVHTVYALLQLPLLVVSWQMLRRRCPTTG